jgi:hypothetical protein
MKNNKTMYENIILDSIDFDGYEVSVPETDKGKIDLVYKLFRKEFIHDYNKNYSDIHNISEWLRGLRSLMTVPFMNYEILNIANDKGIKFDTEDKEDFFLDKYWSRLAESFLILKYNL